VIGRTRCYPLTVTDSYSRFIIACVALTGTETAAVKRALHTVFDQYGLPDAIRSDNGSPFSSRGVAGLSTLSVWWHKLGIRHERIDPGHPEQNGRHERMHRDLKRETASPPATTLAKQQRLFVVSRGTRCRLMSEPVPLDFEAIDLADTTTFADSEGGPLIVMSESNAAHWRGVFDAAGTRIFGQSPCDYDRACATSFGLIDVGLGKALTLETPDNGAFIARPEGALIVRWIGADDAATLISAALALTEDAFTDPVGDLDHEGGRLMMFDSALDGARLPDDRTAAIELPPGRYAVRLCVEWQGDVLGSDGAPHEVMVQALDLRRS
jgi:hypothetical protein